MTQETNERVVEKSVTVSVPVERAFEVFTAEIGTWWPLHTHSIGGDKISHASVRNMMCCTVSGQGAGVAAAVSVRNDTPFDALGVRKIQTELRRQGVRLD